MKNRALFPAVLVANRGEIACRVIRTLRALGIRSVAVYSDADAGARHVLEADQAVRIGPAAASLSYLNSDAIIAACRATGAEAVHPGYGFLSENQAFARALEDAGIVFIGPRVHALNVMGDKIRSKNHVSGFDVPVVPGIAESGLSDEDLIEAAGEVGYPLLIKPSAGGGGKGMHAVERAEDLAESLKTARRVAASAFGDDTLFLERLIRTPRHIEVQVLADSYGNVIHLGERECSLQRRHQKVIEEAPSALLDEATRARIGEAACNAARSVDYVGAGTVEFLVSDDAPDEFFFMEMNTRLQVEHPVTEMVTGVDLVEWQVRIAAGEKLTLAQSDVVLTGHAVEARVYAEDAEAGFLPSAGTVVDLSEPHGEGIRVDSALLPGLEISPTYDPMLSKVIAWAPSRSEALDRLDQALAQTRVAGLRTNVEYLRLLINDDDVRAGRLDTTMIERKLPTLAFRTASDAEIAAAAVVLAGLSTGADPASPWHSRDGWRIGGVHAATPVQLQIGNTSPRTVFMTRDGARSVITIDDNPHQVDWLPAAEGRGTGRAVVDGVTLDTRFAPNGSTLWLTDTGWSQPVRMLSREEVLQTQLASIARTEGAADPEVRSPMPGTVITVNVADGDSVEEGQVLASVEAMKMEHQLTATVAGTVAITLSPGDLVTANQVVARIHPLPSGEPEDPAAETVPTEQEESPS
ncbi:acetyl/propionyl/methylcrotonyl-CoA carboxylase subunit alpha [Arthrobacter tumbae]|uniref:acetyl/propionyl/methylcrotonyl-CoA carboxylase subunit alpha n=1 Tax=Arthrobacter tumbae TaxID=163874 RepID=UPI001959AB28|nr:biotin carboxylase N-terminal domain-containing protein [Arthrobacter tumbae]MBM7782703.1 acetyl-CoA/propionyl-CoA carboxylase biotin carboxyl carrier protein [Arthrobacter tumbae]